MTTRPPTEQLDEQGEVFVLVLFMLAIVGVLGAALAGLVTPSLTHASVVRQLNDSVAAADSGIEYGIQTLHASTAPCVGMPLLSWPSNVAKAPSLNNNPVEVRCQNVRNASIPSGVDYILLVSTAGHVTSRAFVEVNEATGAPTVDSWRTCEDRTDTSCSAPAP